MTLFIGSYLCFGLNVKDKDLSWRADGVWKGREFLITFLQAAVDAFHFYQESALFPGAVPVPVVDIVV